MTLTRSGIVDKQQRAKLHAENLRHRKQALDYVQIPAHKLQMRRLNILIGVGMANLVALLLLSLR